MENRDSSTRRDSRLQSTPGASLNPRLYSPPPCVYQHALCFKLFELPVRLLTAKNAKLQSQLDHDGEDGSGHSSINPQANSPLPQLPPELLALIFAMCDEYDDLLLALTCKLFLRFSTTTATRVRFRYDTDRDGGPVGDFRTQEKRYMLAKFLLCVGRPRRFWKEESWRRCCACLCYRRREQASWDSQLFDDVLSSSSRNPVSMITLAALPYWEKGKLPECPACMTDCLVQICALLAFRAHHGLVARWHLYIHRDLLVDIEYYPAVDQVRMWCCDCVRGQISRPLLGTPYDPLLRARLSILSI